jgi:DNA mismatch repair protein MutS
MSTGEFQAAEVAEGAAPAELARLSPGELLLSDSLAAAPALADWRSAMTPLPGVRFDSQAGARRLCRLYGVDALDGFGSFGRAELAAAGAVVEYVELTQKGRLPRIRPLRRQEPGAAMAIDAATRRSLELTQTLAGERRGSLLDAIDLTLTPGGARRLSARIAAPLTDPIEINRRLDLVQHFLDGPALRQAAREGLARAPDLERALTRLSLGRGGPRDLASLRDGLARAGTLRQTLRTDGLAPPPALLLEALEGLGEHAAFVDLLSRALAAELPLLARDGGFVAAGFRPELDELRTLRDESRRLVLGLERRYRESTGLDALKIRHNNVLGYYVEVPARRADPLLADKATFIHRQTMANAVRFSTVELGELESRIAKAGDQALALELEVFEELARAALARAEAIGAAAAALAELDIATSLAELAAVRRWARPQVDQSLAFRIRRGRHPVVEAALAERGEGPFVPNECDLGPERRLWLLTGPNMAGKSTFLRQNALIAVLAQMGSFVPAESAEIGVVDRLFSRVGAADDLARGRSTFMVEMVEAAAILHQASPRSLVILDEIGRGTATWDGLAIAWAALERLHDVNASRALFATHYHELGALAAKLPALAPHVMRVKEWKGEVKFLHEVAPGAADRSYGIQVARLAGLPADVVARAEAVLAELESSESSGRAAAQRLADDLPLFAARPVAPPAPKGPTPLDEALDSIRPDELTPREALDLLYRLKALRADDA